MRFEYISLSQEKYKQIHSKYRYENSVLRMQLKQFKLLHASQGQHGITKPGTRPPSLREDEEDEDEWNEANTSHFGDMSRGRELKLYNEKIKSKERKKMMIMDEYSKQYESKVAQHPLACIPFQYLTDAYLH